MDKLLDFAYKNWTIIKSVPTVFISFAVIVFCFSLVLVNTIYKERIEILKERLSSKDDMLSEYRQRLHLTDTNKTAYSQLTNQELKTAAFDLIPKMREYLKQTDQQNRNQSDADHQQMIQAKTEEERQKIWNEQTSRLMRTPSVNIEYGAKFQSTAILLRDEILSRLPKDQKDQRAFSMYEHPTNPIGIGMVVNDLERLANGLPK